MSDSLEEDAKSVQNAIARKLAQYHGESRFGAVPALYPPPLSVLARWLMAKFPERKELAETHDNSSRSG